MIFLLPIFPRHFHDIPSDTRINTAIYTIIKTETLTVNNLSFKNKNYPYLQRHESARMQLSSRLVSRQIRNNKLF